MKINENFLNLKDDYLFKTVVEKTNSFKQKNPHSAIIRLGIGDVTLPLPSAVVKALERAATEMGQIETFRGYGEYQGYEFLRTAIASYYKRRNVTLNIDEIFVSDGAKSDLANILDIFSTDNTVLIPDPVYPVYVDTNIMAGRKLVYVNGNKENNFLPLPNYDIDADIIYLCSPNNPTGAVYSFNQLKMWVDYALSKDAVILFDAAYEAFVLDESLPRSIFEVEGAEKCCIEFCSLSKTAGFTGTRCGYTVVPLALEKCGQSLNKLWLRRQSTKFNGVSYIIQRGAEAVFLHEGLDEILKNINYYITNARLISNTLTSLNIWFTGGINSPYIWLKCPNSFSSWEFFDFLLREAQIVGTPGVGFGKNGDGYFRLTAFNSFENTQEAMERIEKCIKKWLS